MRKIRKYDCILLAAGRSERMGKWKLTLPVKESTIVESAARRALTSVGRVILVTGYRSDELKEIFSSEERWNSEERKRLLFVRNDDYMGGMFSSIQRGCREVGTDRFFLALGDMPLVDESTFHALAAAPEVDAVIPKFKGKRGHPLLMTRSMAERIISAPEESTLHHILAEVPTMSIPVSDKFILNDIDTEKDYLELQKNLNDE